MGRCGAVHRRRTAGLVGLCQLDDRASVADAQARAHAEVLHGQALRTAEQEVFAKVSIGDSRSGQRGTQRVIHVGRHQRHGAVGRVGLEHALVAA